MRTSAFISALLVSFSLHAQTALELTQSSAEQDWEKIQNEFVELIYPTDMRAEAPYIAALIKHYAREVGLSYGIAKPKRFPLILRSEMADPNGFVTLAPRRSEWFANSTFTTFVGSSEWYQTLAIHEYRHVIQFDHYKQDLTKVLTYFFGDTGQLVSLFSGLQPWYFEGDAVWAETVYTDAGRGRSPAFMARLKALLLSGELPSYDQWIGGTFNNRIPNHYVFGYAIVARAYHKFGPDFWRKISYEVTRFPHPRRLYHVFKRETGQELEDFYEDTLRELKDQWLPETLPQVTEDYRESIYPFHTRDGLYALEYNMDGYWRLTLNKATLVELPFMKGINQFHLRDGHAVYTQFLPHARYSFKGSSDLVLIDLTDRTHQRLTQGLRLYSPRLTAQKTIQAIEFNDQQEWLAVEFDLKGKKLRELKVATHKFAEIHPFSETHFIAVIANATGHKSVEKIAWSGEREEWLKPSRNNIFALHTYGEDVFFEAQSQGKVDIFRLRASGELARCTHSIVSANSPSVHQDTLYFSQMDGAGSTIATAPLSACQTIASDALVDFNYLGTGPSDNYAKSALKAFPEQLALTTATPESTPAPYGDFTKELLLPHSWSFLGGRGFALSARTDNYLRTLSASALLGSGAEENANYSEFNFDIKKFYPIISLNGGLRDRAIEIFDSNDVSRWKERSLGASVTLPWIKKINLYNSVGLFSGGANYLHTGHYQFNSTNLAMSDRHFQHSWLQGTYSLAKDLYARSILSPWSAELALRYDNADSLQESDYSAHRFFQAAQFTTPSFFKHHGIKLNFQREVQSADQSAYRFSPFNASPTGYVFSRGYDYESVEEYKKGSFNYVLPLATPDWNLWGWYYLKRMTLNGFYDTTRTEINAEKRTYSSYGGELEFDSKILRVIPIGLGVRYLYKQEFDSQAGEVYFALGSQL